MSQDTFSTDSVVDLVTSCILGRICERISHHEVRKSPGHLTMTDSHFQALEGQGNRPRYFKKMGDSSETIFFYDPDTSRTHCYHDPFSPQTHVFSPFFPVSQGRLVIERIPLDYSPVSRQNRRFYQQEMARIDQEDAAFRLGDATASLCPPHPKLAFHPQSVEGVYASASTPLISAALAAE